MLVLNPAPGRASGVSLRAPDFQKDPRFHVLRNSKEVFLTPPHDRALVKDRSSHTLPELMTTR